MSRVLSRLKKQCRRQPAIWRYGFNLKPSLDFILERHRKLTGESRRIVSDLNRDGIAISSVGDCLGSDTLFDLLEEEVGGILNERKTELQEMRARSGETDSIGEKTFNVQLLGPEVSFDPKSVFARFALQEAFLNIANAYFGMITKLRYYDVWYTFATDSERRESQLWHFDREDNLILKIFVYLDDVSPDAGPFTYAPQTHKKGVLRNVEPEYFDEKGVRRSTDEQMSAVVDKESWISAVGKKGTIVFADTRGFHKGGDAKAKDRLMYLAMFTSPASASHRLLKFSGKNDFSELSKSQVTALEI